MDELEQALGALILKSCGFKDKEIDESMKEFTDDEPTVKAADIPQELVKRTRKELGFERTPAQKLAAAQIAQRRMWGDYFPDQQ